MNSERIKLLKDAILLEVDIDAVRDDLKSFSFDSVFPLVNIGVCEFDKIMKMYLSQAISLQELENWAEFLECRDDIGFPPPAGSVIHETIHKIANPLLFGNFTYDKAHEALKEIENI